MARLPVFLASIWLSFPILAYAVTSLCINNEDVLLSCRSNKKLVSICASRDLSETNGYIKYRFGLRDNVELEYPKGNEHPSKAFTFKTTMGTHGGTEALQFKNGDYFYTVWRNWDRGIDERGITVRRDGKPISRIKCRSEFIGDWGLNWEIEKMHKAGIPEPIPEDDYFF